MRESYLKFRQLSVRACLRLSVTLILLAGISDAAEGGGWTALPKNTSQRLTRLHFLDSLNGWVVGDSGVIMKTTDGGLNWAHQNANIDKGIVDVHFLNPRTGWAIAHVIPDFPPYIFGTIILSTSNGGAVWDTTFYPDDVFNAIWFVDSLKGWMGGIYGRLVGTTNAGENWFPANVDSSFYARWDIKSIKFHSPQLGLAVGGRIDLTGVVWRTTNGGQRWTALEAGIEPLWGIHFKDSLTMLCVGGDHDFGSGQVTSTNGGETWLYEPLNIWGEARALSFRTPAEGWAPLGFAATMMFTLDSGRTWTDVYTPDTTAMFDLVFTDSLTGYMVGAGGTILKYSADPVSVREENLQRLPAGIFLHPNYPNPFNPTTAIRYDLSRSGHVTLEVYDLLGREVFTRALGEHPPGQHRMEFREPALASGIYLFRITVASGSGPPLNSNVRKMLLVR